MIKMNDLFFIRKFAWDDSGTVKWFRRSLKAFKTEREAIEDSRILWKLGYGIEIIETKPDKWCVFYRHI